MFTVLCYIFRVSVSCTILMKIIFYYCSVYGIRRGRPREPDAPQHNRGIFIGVLKYRILTICFPFQVCN